MFIGFYSIITGVKAKILHSHIHNIEGFTAELQ